VVTSLGDSLLIALCYGLMETDEQGNFRPWDVASWEDIGLGKYRLMQLEGGPGETVMAYTGLNAATYYRIITDDEHPGFSWSGLSCKLDPGNPLCERPSRGLLMQNMWSMQGVVGYAGDLDAYQSDFTDTWGHTDIHARQRVYEPWVTAAHRYGVVDGYPDGTFRFKNAASRALLASVLVRAYRLELPPRAALESMVIPADIAHVVDVAGVPAESRAPTAAAMLTDLENTLLRDREIPSEPIIFERDGKRYELIIREAR